MKRLLVVSALCVALLPMSAVAQRRGGGRVFVGVGPSFGYGGFGYGPGYYGYGPYGYGPFGGFGYYGNPNAGQVKFDTKAKDAQVYIDGSFAGTVKQLKTVTLEKGNYNIEVRIAGRAPFQQRIYVIPGKKMTIHLDLIPPPVG